MSGERVSDYDFDLPPELIALRPLPQRQDSRMMVLHRAEEKIEHRRFADLPEFAWPGDVFVLNNTRVVHARQFSDDQRVEFLFLKQLGPGRWKCLVKPGRRMRMGARTIFRGVEATVQEIANTGERVIQLAEDIDVYAGGVLPLPPYIDRPSDAEDEVRYQTVFASNPGAVAAPTAGLHFTPEILGRIPHTFVTLHVGLGTFQPIQVEEIARHKMHAERFQISPGAADQINAARRIISVGTTSVRVLESAWSEEGQIQPQEGSTEIFIHPPYEFQVVDALLTNFHLPQSTLLMLVSAFAGRDFILRAYREAIAQRYRFFSYGDCMLIL